METCKLEQMTIEHLKQNLNIFASDGASMIEVWDSRKLAKFYGQHTKADVNKYLKIDVPNLTFDSVKAVAVKIESLIKEHSFGGEVKSDEYILSCCD